MLGYGVIGGMLLMGGLASTYARNAAASDDTVQTADARGGQAADVTAGQGFFRRACNKCHPNGGEDVGPSILNKNIDEAKMIKAIRSGSGRMRAISVTKLPDANLPALMAYLRSIHAVR
jgi:mono/diheme cytochrome c family protein